MDNDNAIAGDPLAIPHLLPPVTGHPTTVAQFAGLAGALAGDRECWAPLVRYDAVSRWYHRLRTGPGYEVWLLSWVPGQGSGRHDHGASSGVCAVLSGALTEDAGARGARVLTPGSLRVFGPGYVHEMVNASLEPAVSLHIYFPGLTEMRMYPREAAAPVSRAALGC
ncbi:cysteine dioxygenase [Streptomyces sp. MS19]|uniref:cysteine dioxygenase n=1 Tax=Streptomyces sp. MS19 TaxID=3385972 RepID=UPI0039A365BB